MNVEVRVWFGDGGDGVGPLEGFVTAIHDDGTADLTITDDEWLRRLHWEAPLFQSRCRMRVADEEVYYDDYMWTPIEGQCSEVPIRISRFDRV